MLGKIIATCLLMVGAGIVLGLTDVLAFEAIGTFLLLVGGAALAFMALVAVVLAIEGVLFRSTDRWHRFN